MIGRLQGLLVERGADGLCLVDVNGVGYDVLLPAATVGLLPRPPELCTVLVHTHVREDEITLYGFATPEDRAAFRALVSVSQIGPKLAMAVLSVLDAKNLARAIAKQDRTAFTGISGVGKKTVERLLLELKDKLLYPITSSGEVAAPIRASAAKPEGPLATVHAALVQLGYRPVDAERAISVVTAHAEGKAVEELLREALATLG